MTISDFDFRRPPPGSLEQLVTEWLTDACNRVPGTWAKLLPFPATLEVLKVESITTADAMDRLPEGAVSFAMTVGSHPESAPLIGMSRPVLLGLMLGTMGDIVGALPNDREFSDVEKSLAPFVVRQLLLELLQSAWTGTEDLHLSIRDWGPPRQICTLPPNDLILNAVLLVGGEFGSHPIQLTMPRTDFVHSLARPAASPDDVKPVDHSTMEAVVCEMPIEVAIALGTAEITMNQLADLSPGDLVILDQKVTEPLSARVGGKEKFMVWPGAVGRRQAVQIDTTVEK